MEFWLDDEGWLTGRFQLDPESGRIVDATAPPSAKPVSVGRALRIVPDRTRRLVLYRDAHHCRILLIERDAAILDALAQPDTSLAAKRRRLRI